MDFCNPLVFVVGAQGGAGLIVLVLQAFGTGINLFLRNRFRHDLGVHPFAHAAVHLDGGFDKARAVCLNGVRVVITGEVVDALVAHLDAGFALVGQQVAHQVAEVFDRLGELRVGRGCAVDDVLTEIGVPLTAFFRGHVRKLGGEAFADTSVDVGELGAYQVDAGRDVVVDRIGIRSAFGEDDVGNLA